jgi:2,3-diketo-5-methylthio-1-phosphopentane phosphatase
LAQLAPGIVIDFDGTVTETDIGDAIVKRFALPGWDVLEERFRRGEVTIRQLWSQEISHLPGERKDDMVRFALDTARVRPGLKELVALAHSRGAPVEVASNGIEFYVKAVLAANGLADLNYVCLDADLVPGRPSRMAAPDGLTLCARNELCKCARIWRLQRQGRKVLFVGDGASDACAADQAEVLVARSSLAKLADSRGIPYVPFTDFFDVIRALEPMLPPL